MIEGHAIYGGEGSMFTSVHTWACLVDVDKTPGEEFVFVLEYTDRKPAQTYIDDPHQLENPRGYSFEIRPHNKGKYANMLNIEDEEQGQNLLMF